MLANRGGDDGEDESRRDGDGGRGGAREDDGGGADAALAEKVVVLARYEGKIGGGER